MDSLPVLKCDNSNNICCMRNSDHYEIHGTKLSKSIFGTIKLYTEFYTKFAPNPPNKTIWYNYRVTDTIQPRPNKAVAPTPMS